MYLFWALPLYGITNCGIFHLFFSILFSSFILRNLHQYMNFYGPIICHYMVTPHFVYSSTDGGLRCFHFLTIKNNAAMSSFVQVFEWTPVLHFLGYKPRSATAASYVTLCLTFFVVVVKLFEELTHCSPNSVAMPFYIPNSNIWEFHILHNFPNIYCLYFFL